MVTVYYNGNTYTRHRVFVFAEQGTKGNTGFKALFKARRHYTNYPWQ